MATLAARFARRRPQYAARVYYTRLLHGRLHASVWPRGRSEQPSPKQQRSQDAFKASLWFVKHMHEREVTPWREALERFHRANRGLRGSAAIRLRDLLMQSIRGRLFSFYLPGIGWLHSAAVHREITMLLDWFEPHPGSLMARGDDTWKPTVPCQTGAVLTMSPESATANCCEPNRIAKRSELP